MKMKKNILLFSLTAVLFSMTGCASNQEELGFEYTPTSIVSSTMYQANEFQNASEPYRALLENSEEAMAEIELTAISNFDTLKEECGEFEGYRSNDGECIQFDFAKLAATDQEEYMTAVAEYAEFVGNVKADITEEGDTVIVELTAVYSGRDAIYTFIYEENPAYAYAEALYGQTVNPFQISEVTASPDYSLGEKMEKAAYNTLMGMGTVFVVLIFIAFIIAQFDKINKLGVKLDNWMANRKNKDADMAKEETAPVVTAPVVTPVANPMDDSQLVAVITAAVVASNVAAGGSDKLVVRSIRKAKR